MNNDLPHNAFEAFRRDRERAAERARERQRNLHIDLINQIHHDEILQAQSRLIDSNKQVANEIHGIRDSLQEQIDQTQKELEESKLENKRIAKRSWWQFGLSLVVSIVSVAISAVALYFSIRK